MCCPLKYRKQKSKTYLVQHLTELFGDKELSEKALKEFATQRFVILVNRVKAERQVKITIRFLARPHHRGKQHHILRLLAGIATAPAQGLTFCHGARSRQNVLGKIPLPVGLHFP